MLNKNLHMTNFLFFILFFPAIFISQTTGNYIQKNAINCNNLSDTNLMVYNAIKNYKCISVGEMHGTNEPAAFVLGLVKSFISNNRKVILGMEIENRKIAKFSKNNKEKYIKESDFFTISTNDGRNSEGWYNLIKEANKLENVKFCFFDTELGFNITRDSVMASNILKKYLVDTNYVIITLTGNIHNKTILHNENKTMGCYLKDYFGPKLISIYHLYGKGTMYNNSGKGLSIVDVEPTNNTFNDATNYTNYFIFNKFQNYFPGYSAFIFTKLITASLTHQKSKK